MDYRTFADIILTAAIALFAFLTWRTTRSYARLTGLGLLLQYHEKILTLPEGNLLRSSVDALTVIRREFPEIYDSLKVRINPEIRNQIEHD
jgi:hypothetical protein